MILDQNLAIYTAFYKESESEVKKYKILEPRGKMGKTNVKRNFSIFYFFNLPKRLNVGLWDNVQTRMHSGSCRH